MKEGMSTVEDQDSHFLILNGSQSSFRGLRDSMCTDPSLPVSPAFHLAKSFFVCASSVSSCPQCRRFPLVGHILLLFPQPFPLLPLQFTMAMLASLQIPFDHAILSALRWLRDDPPLYFCDSLNFFLVHPYCHACPLWYVQRQKQGKAVFLSILYSSCLATSICT